MVDPLDYVSHSEVHPVRLNPIMARIRLSIINIQLLANDLGLTKKLPRIGPLLLVDQVYEYLGCAHCNLGVVYNRDE